MGKFVIKETKTGQTFHLKANNNETVAVSEVYTSLNACKNGIKSVIKNAEKAKIEDQTKKDFIKEKNPKFEIYKDKNNYFRFRLKAPNGEIIAASQAYTTKAACKNGVASVKRNVVNAKIIHEETK